VRVPFTWKVTDWFMVEWSPEFPIGEPEATKVSGSA
jgi:3-ketosteroid 9alpha-monooxygenase subunit A